MALRTSLVCLVAGVAALLVAACEQGDAKPEGPIRHVFKDFVLQVPDRGACHPADSKGSSVHLTMRPPDPTWLRQKLRPLVPPFADRPCPAEAAGLDVRLHQLDGTPPMLGRGNLLWNAPDGPATAIGAIPMSGAEASILRPFFGERSVRPLVGRTPPVLYTCEGADCRAAFASGAAIVTVLWRRSGTPAAPHEIVDYVASHIGQWSLRDPCESSAFCSVQNRQAYEQGRRAAQAAFADGDPRGVSVEVLDSAGGLRPSTPGFVCAPIDPTVARPIAEDGDGSPIPTDQGEWALGFNDRIWQLGGALKQSGCRLSPDEAMLRTPPPAAQRSIR